MARKSTARILKELNAKLLPWQSFEIEVANFVVKEVSEGALGLESEKAVVRPKPAYFSKEREKEINFDVSIEVYSSSNSHEPILIWIWECKNYPRKKVTVDEVEEFHSKVRQVGAHKGTMVTRCGFQEGAITFARTHHIGLLVLKKTRSAYLALSKDTGLCFVEAAVGSFCLYTSGKEETPDKDLNDLIWAEFRE